MIYLVDIDEKKKEIELRKWKNEKRFPMQAQMMEFLSKNGAVFFVPRLCLRMYIARFCLDS